MSYDKIINPKTGRKVNLNSKLGKEIINNYILQLGGYNSVPMEVDDYAVPMDVDDDVVPMDVDDDAVPMDVDDDVVPMDVDDDLF